MEILPAIDLMEGRVVRLLKGDPKTVRRYDHWGNPVSVARTWESQGAMALHIVDLDAALNKGRNLDAIYEIADAVSIPIQVGGGIRELETAQDLLDRGIDRIVLGALAFREPCSLTKLRQRFGVERVIVALDHLDRRVMVEGWKSSTQLEIEEALSRFLDLQIEKFLITSIAKDGTLAGPDLDALRRACAYDRAKIIAAGGVTSLNDIAILKRIGIRGVVIGKALYEGLFTLREALKVIGGNER